MVDPTLAQESGLDFALSHINQGWQAIEADCKRATGATFMLAQSLLMPHIKANSMVSGMRHTA